MGPRVREDNFIKSDMGFRTSTDGLTDILIELIYKIGGMSEIVLKNMNLVFKSGFHGFHPYSSKRLISQSSSFD